MHKNSCAHTLCSRTSFFATFSKYPSHIFLKRSRISFSTSSSSASNPSGGNAVSAVSLVSKASLPGSVVADICFEGAGGARPRKGCAYDLRKVVRRGKDDSEGSLDNLTKKIIRPHAMGSHSERNVPGPATLSSPTPLHCAKEHHGSHRLERVLHRRE
jgi:hypothetical protein